ncbi:MAG: preprotein translocase subunit SecE [Chromatiales bacterium]|nr:preprotein translocase subunit SecE [Gammaproteobacteria bacterium]MCP5352029.1 preprotein translocase subunit SecE [Chromatiales bacterium]
MSNNVSEAGGSPLDYAKWAGVAALLIGGIFGFYHFAAQPMVVRVVLVLVAFGLAGWLAVTTTVGGQAWAFMQDSRTEVRKVVWPTRQETLQTTLAVVVMVLITGILLWLLDMFLLWAVKLLTGQGG